jgi:hypothetical protein
MSVRVDGAERRADLLADLGYRGAEFHHGEIASRLALQFDSIFHGT